MARSSSGDGEKRLSRRSVIGAGIGASAGLGAGGARLLAQDATPSAAGGQSATASPAASPVASSPGISLAAGGLINPRGMAWSSDGTMFVALAGSGGTTMNQSSGPHDEEYGPFFAGNTASVVRIEGFSGPDTTGCPVSVAGGLPSTRGMGGHTQGPAAVAFLGDQLYVLQDSGTPAATAFPGLPNGVYSVNSDESVTLVADIKSWHDRYPVTHVPYDLTVESETFAMLPGDGFLWVLESNSGQVLQVIPNALISRIADLSDGHPVPTGFALTGDGGVYVGHLTPAPYTDGTSKVVKVSPDGTVTDVWTGLTMLTGLAVGPDGTLYALEMATNNISEPPYTSPGTGRVVRQTGPDSLAEVVVGLDFPIAMAIGPDDALYVSFPAFGAQPGFGGILRVDLSAPQPMRVSADILSLNPCNIQPGLPPSPDADDSMMATPMATPDGTPMSMATPAPEAEDAAERANDGGKSATGAQAVEIQNFAFHPATLDVPVGTTVNWTNLDAAAHTVTSDDGTFDSGNLNTHQSFSYRFDKAGTNSYHCDYHPSMLGTVTVR
jgi:plastocyanin/sugar lactone lactonase YvrE